MWQITKRQKSFVGFVADAGALLDHLSERRRTRVSVVARLLSLLVYLVALLALLSALASTAAQAGTGA
jgi:hypothetical protein